MNRRLEIRYSQMWHKLHGLIGIVIGVFILWMVVWGVILSNREPIRAITHKFDNYPHPKYALNFPEGSISMNKALRLGWEALGKKEHYKRIEIKWEGGAPIYRIRFKDKNKSEVTIHALTGKILIFPTQDKELKKIAQDSHVLSFLSDNARWVFDGLSILVLFTIISGIVIFFKGKMFAGTLARKIHIIASMVISLPFLIMAITGIMLHHEEWLESKSTAYVSSTSTEKPSLDYDYDLLPVTVQKAVEIFQNQFPQPRVLRRVVLNYKKESQTLTWDVEPNDGMRVMTSVDAYTGEMIKSNQQVQLVEWVDQLHEMFLFGETSKYVVDVLALLLALSLVTGWILTPQTLRRRVFRYRAKEAPLQYALADIVAHQEEYVQNINPAGLCFKAKRHLKKGATIFVEMPLPTIKKESKVLWCRKSNGHYNVGIQFMHKDGETPHPLIDQGCDIEDYKSNVLEKDGRVLTGEEAALEWLHTRQTA